MDTQHPSKPGPHLVTVPSCSVWKRAGRPVFDRKFFDGMVLYCALWPGQVTCIIRADEGPLPDFGTVSLPAAKLPFRCVLLEGRERIGARHLESADLILASGDMPDQLHISWLCRLLGKKCVYGIEYIMETRKQILSMSGAGTLTHAKESFHILLAEIRRRCAFSLADAIQANGYPAYNEYAFLPNRLLYFDTRVNHDLLIDDAALAAKQSQVEQGAPLHLAFSGRLIKMKGANDLIDIARGLDERGIPFQLSIFGAGDEVPAMQTAIDQSGLGHCVHLRGAVDFYGVLIPEIKRSVDLYLLPHKQSDPSCTYFETFACGIPIVGYTNRAFAGILSDAEVGWGVAMNDVRGAVDTIARLHANRRLISAAAARAVALARNHDFETTFLRRMTQLADLVGATPNAFPARHPG